MVLKIHGVLSQTAMDARYQILLSEITGYSPGDSRSPQALLVPAITLQNKLVLSSLLPLFVPFMLSEIILQDFLSGKQ